MDDESFFRSTLKRVVFLIEKYGKEEEMKAAALRGKKIPEPPRTARSIKEVLSRYGK